MTKVLWLVFPIILCGLLHKTNAGPGVLNKNNIHYTNIGDISPKDIVRLAEEATPADKRFLMSPVEKAEDSAENDMETERNMYIHENNSPDLSSPKDQEEKFVQILKKQYKGTFPEYAKETVADYAGNKELDDNLNVQPETVFLGHSDMYHGKRRENEDTSDLEAPEDDPTFENLDTFDNNDSDSLSSYSQDAEDFHAKISDPNPPLSHTNQPATADGNNYDNARNDDLVAEDAGTSGTSGDDDKSLGIDDDQDEVNNVTEKPQKTEEDRMQDSPTKTEDNTHQKLVSHDKKKKNRKEETTKEAKSNKDGNSAGGILDEFDDFKGYNNHDKNNKNRKEKTKKEVKSNKDDGGGMLDEFDDSTARHHSKQPAMDGNVYDNAGNDHVGTDDDAGTEEDAGASGTTGDEDKPLGTDKYQEEANNMAGENIKTEDDTMEDLPTKTEDNSRQTLSHDKKMKNRKEETKKEGKSNKDGNSAGGILDEFADFKGYNKTKQEGLVVSKGDSEQRKTPSLEHQTENESGKKINFIHTEDSQATNDAIFDFLDKLLEKDPQALRHGVLKLAKEMGNEENIQIGRTPASLAENQNSHASRPKNTKIKQRARLGNGRLPKNNDEGQKVDKWISELESKKDTEKEAYADTNQAENPDSFDDEEYNEYHESPDIYPDHNAGETTLSESVYDAASLGDTDQEARESKEREKDKKEMEDRKMEQAKFDYEEFKEESLKMHNEFRRRHKAAALEWSDDLSKKAHDVAKHLTSATRNNFKRQLEKRGQNIAILPYTTKDIAKSAVQKWYSEITMFSFANPEVKAKTRDFTQIIWSGSKRLGMGFAHSANKKKMLVVALYSPAGNNPKEMRSNLNMLNYDLYADIRKAIIERLG